MTRPRQATDGSDGSDAERFLPRTVRVSQRSGPRSAAQEAVRCFQAWRSEQVYPCSIRFIRLIRGSVWSSGTSEGQATGSTTKPTRQATDGSDEPDAERVLPRTVRVPQRAGPRSAAQEAVRCFQAWRSESVCPCSIRFIRLHPWLCLVEWNVRGPSSRVHDQANEASHGWVGWVGCRAISPADREGFAEIWPTVRGSGNCSRLPGLEKRAGLPLPHPIHPTHPWLCPVRGSARSNGSNVSSARTPSMIEDRPRAGTPEKPRTAAMLVHSRARSAGIARGKPSPSPPATTARHRHAAARTHHAPPFRPKGRCGPHGGRPAA